MMATVGPLAHARANDDVQPPDALEARARYWTILAEASA
jgi:hypothetical protein